MQNSRSVLKYDHETILKIENTLNKMTVNGISLGGLFANFIYPSLFLQGYDTSAKTRTRLSIQKLKYRFLPLLRWNKIPVYATHRKFIFNYTSNIPKLTSFFTPLLKNLSHEDVLTVSIPGNQLTVRETDPFDFYGVPSRLSLWQYAGWLKSYKSLSASFSEIELILLHDLDIHPVVVKHLQVILMHQTQTLHMLLGLLEKVQPHAVITDHDRQTLNSALIIAAKIKRIKTYTFIHGSTNPPYNYIPLIADYMLCWGEKHIRQFHALGIGQSRLLLAGNPRLEYAPVKRVEHKEPVLLSNPIALEERMRLAEVFCLGVSELWKTYQLSGYIKLHPSETKSDYEGLVKKYPFVQLISSDEMNAAALFNRFDIFISHNSIMGLDALIKGKQVIILNPSGITFDLGIGKDLIEYAGCKQATDHTELTEAITTNIEQPAGTIDKREQYINDYCRYFENASAEQIIRLISQP